MEIILPPDFLQILKDKFLLLDTCVFIDAFSHPSEFGKFFNKLKDNETSLLTIDDVITEFLKGSSTDTKFDEKKEFINDIIETSLPTNNLQENVERLIKIYKIESKDLSITDLHLGATLMKFKNRIYLLTRDHSDFPTRIFKRENILNISHGKGIFTYGIYSNP